MNEDEEEYLPLVDVEEKAEEPEAPLPSRHPQWLVPALGLLAVLIVWLVFDALMYNPRLFQRASDKERVSSELVSIRESIWRDEITPDGAQTRLDSLVRKYPRAADKLEVLRVQRQIDLARRESYPTSEAPAKQPEWPLILSLPPPAQGH